MQQRVGIARAFAISPKMLLLDEPFGMLDSLTRMELQEVLADLLARDCKTSLMVTHDVDEALLMADRIVMMTSGPAATIGEIVHVPFARPRNRTAVLNHPDYYPLRERLIEFLEDQDHRPAAAPVGEAKSDTSDAQPADGAPAIVRFDAAAAAADSSTHHQEAVSLARRA
jgi:nitrate/nitrite transport system ATP-binding protein